MMNSTRGSSTTALKKIDEKSQPKKVRILESQMNADESGKKFDTLNLIKTMFNTPIESGITFLQNRERNKLYDKFEKVKPGDEVELNEAELELMISIFAPFKWVYRMEIIDELAIDLGL